MLDVVKLNLEYMYIVVLVVGCVLCVEIIVGNVVFVGGVVLVLMMLVLVLLMYVVFDVDE